MNKLWENISYIVMAFCITSSIFLIGVIVVNYDNINNDNNDQYVASTNTNNRNSNSRKDGKNNKKQYPVGQQQVPKSDPNIQRDDAFVLSDEQLQDRPFSQENQEISAQNFEENDNIFGLDSSQKDVVVDEKVISGNFESFNTDEQENVQYNDFSEQEFDSLDNIDSSVSQQEKIEDIEPNNKLLAFRRRHFNNPNFYQYIEQVLQCKPVTWDNLNSEDLFSFFQEEPDKFFNAEQRSMIIQAYLADYNIRILLKDYINNTPIRFSQLIKFGFTWEQLAFYFEFINPNFHKYIQKVLEGQNIVWRELGTIHSRDLMVFFKAEPDKFFTPEQRNMIIKSYLNNYDIRSDLKECIKENHDLFSQLIRFGFTWEQLSFYFEFENKNFATYINNVLKGKKNLYIDPKDLNIKDLTVFFIEDSDKFLTYKQKRLIIHSYLANYNIRTLLTEYIRQNPNSFRLLKKFGFTWEQLAFYFKFVNRFFHKYILDVLEGKKIEWHKLKGLHEHDFVVFFDEEPDKFFTPEQRNMIIESYLSDRDSLSMLIEDVRKNFSFSSKLIKFGFSSAQMDQIYSGLI
ncbi:MAG: hypothetical protein Q8889_01625 [Candidatus Phytoplasma australasiaticum]|nr:hypothetical protein [Candidatus Phytoplasma australasiaticum]MDV3199808.1 hypothetical protein [Candidatus Phytoplasma australasiaticum]